MKLIDPHPIHPKLDTRIFEFKFDEVVRAFDSFAQTEIGRWGGMGDQSASSSSSAT